MGNYEYFCAHLKAQNPNGYLFEDRDPATPILFRFHAEVSAPGIHEIHPIFAESREEAVAQARATLGTVRYKGLGPAHLRRVEVGDWDIAAIRSPDGQHRILSRVRFERLPLNCLAPEQPEQEGPPASHRFDALAYLTRGFPSHSARKSDAKEITPKPAPVKALRPNRVPEEITPPKEKIP